MRNEQGALEITEDKILGGRLRLRQPRRGHRIGHDAILLAASTSGAYGENAADLGAGTGGAAFALAARIPGLKLSLVEIDPVLCQLALANARINNLDDRVRVVAQDVTSPKLFSLDGLEPGTFHRVLMNPPFHDPGRTQTSPDLAKQLARTAVAGTLPAWIAAAARLLMPKGVLTMIWRADELPRVLDALSHDFPGIAVLPVYPRAGAPAIRVLLRAVKGIPAPLAMLPGLSLNDANGKPSAAAEAVLRGAEVLALAKL